ncbi:Cytochrome subunit of sulfide dehydrogenase [Pandoraea capi]|uniref:Cytochrome subunit of sulfide dehydrogenase n=1 Tax=Pandoraea capi TaxID=2508286 RepID=A0ABY6W8Q0_9BURK|nr:hypothetical protein [Pandoraea capi]VVE40027.1 Cytochrome subunit of sulfide dehydrogenase [Pandoraea capi]
MRTRLGHRPTPNRHALLRHSRVTQRLVAVFVSATVGGWLVMPGVAMAGATAATPSQPDWQARDWAMACMSCHNAAAPVHAGKATLRALEGRSATAMMASLQAMRDGRQSATLMPQLLKGYRDDELQRIAAYFATQPVAAQPVATRPAAKPPVATRPTAPR